MAIDPSVSYPGKIGTPSADYPYGSAQNITSPGDGTGTPWEAALVNDIFGFQQELLSKANITPTGNPEKVNASQYLDALRNILGANVTTLNAAGSPYTLTQAQAGFVLVDASAGAVSVTLPAATVVKGINFKFIRIDTTVANAVTINRAGTDLIDGATSFNLLYKVPVYLDSDNSSNWYNSLVNPDNQYQTISATMAANAVTIAAVNAAPLQFRNATLTSGTISTVSVPSANLVIPAGATLGTVNGIQSTIVVAEMNNAGTREFAVRNILGEIDISESGVISTTAISAAATSANVWYSTTGRANLPYQIVGIFKSTQATAGQWATSASLVQPIFKNASSLLGQYMASITGATADVSLAVGQAVTIDFSAATSVPLHVSTNDNQLYEIILACQGNGNTTAVTILQPNNTTYTNFFRNSGIIENAGASSVVNTYSNGILLAIQHDIRSGRYLVSTKTASKWAECVSHGLYNNASINFNTHTSTWQAVASTDTTGDTATVWTSLGTLTFPVASTGRATIRRIS